MKHLVVQILIYLCLLFLSEQAYAQFLGGQADGHANLRLSNIVCAVVNVNPFLGGRSDGHANLRLSNIVCPVVNVNPFLGGQSDGHANLKLTNVAPPLCLLIVLPIELLYFEADCMNNKVKVKWATVSEIGNNHFTIERSKDAIIFETVGILKGAGNSKNLINYYFDDIKPLNGTSYYRLKQTDYNDKSEYSKMASVNCNGEVKNVNVYPNPISEELTIEIEGSSELVEFKIVNALGVVVYKGALSKKITIPTTSFIQGIYLLKFENQPTQKATKDTFESKKIIKF